MEAGVPRPGMVPLRPSVNAGFQEPGESIIRLINPLSFPRTERHLGMLTFTFKTGMAVQC